MQIREGQTATNPKTGQKVVFRGGQWVNAGATLRPSKPSAAAEKQAIGNKNALFDLGSVERQLGRVEQLYNEGFKGVGPGSLLEYLPTPQGKQFDAAAAALSPILKPLIRAPGEGTWTDKDQEMLDGLVPQRKAMDSEIEERIKAIRGLISDRKAKHGAKDGWKVTRVK